MKPRAGLSRAYWSVRDQQARKKRLGARHDLPGTRIEQGSLGRRAMRETFESSPNQKVANAPKTTIFAKRWASPNSRGASKISAQPQSDDDATCSRSRPTIRVRSPHQRDLTGRPASDVQCRRSRQAGIGRAKPRAPKGTPMGKNSAGVRDRAIPAARWNQAGGRALNVAHVNFVVVQTLPPIPICPP